MNQTFRFVGIAATILGLGSCTTTAVNSPGYRANYVYSSGYTPPGYTTNYYRVGSYSQPNYQTKYRKSQINYQNGQPNHQKNIEKAR